jgi:hypothetical protein
MVPARGNYDSCIKANRPLTYSNIVVNSRNAEPSNKTTDKNEDEVNTAIANNPNLACIPLLKEGSTNIDSTELLHLKILILEYAHLWSKNETAPEDMPTAGSMIKFTKKANARGAIDRAISKLLSQGIIEPARTSTITHTAEAYNM